MRQVLFHLPFTKSDYFPEGFPIFGFGTMLCIAIPLCAWLAARRARKEGIAPELIYDTVLWIVFAGLIGARIVFMVHFHQPIARFFFIWEGGLEFYGSAVGGLVGYCLVYWLVLRKQGVSTWQLADIIAPSIALGLCLGRIGCFLNGCCYGNVACPDCLAVHFPMSSPPRFVLTEKGLQDAAGFTMREVSAGAGARLEDRTVGAVDPGSPAAQSGLQPGDVITKVDGHAVNSYSDLWLYLVRNWPRGKTDLKLTVERGNQVIDLPSFEPRTLGLHPTQLYESVSTLLIFLLLTAYYPFRRRPGEVMILLMLCYAVHRFINEMLRNDTDPITLFPGSDIRMTLSQYGSILVFVAALGLGWWLWWSPRRGVRPGLTNG
jgi:phosphatidylglycerol:prolipoprotein diacylglycerol transferase